MFADRVDAGRQLARRLHHLDTGDVVVLGLPRGGVVVAAEVARALSVPLDVIVVRKLPTPNRPELGLGAIGEDGVSVLNHQVIRGARIRPAVVAATEAACRWALDRHVPRLRGDRPPIALRGRTAVIVDDGVATGATACAACQVARARGAARVILAVPVASSQALVWLQKVADEVICLNTDECLLSIEAWYRDFTQVTDEQVTALLAPAAALYTDREVTIPLGVVELPGRLTIPDNPHGTVVFAHGSGSSRHSPRNQYVAMLLGRAGLGTLLFDLLTPEEADNRRNIFDINLLADRLHTAVEWLRHQPEGTTTPIGLYGASTGAAAALWAATEPGADIAAIVSRGGRPDLAGRRLPQITAPTLLIVGGNDPTVLALNESAQQQLRCPNRLAVVPGASHLFDEPGTLSTAATLARDWFTEHLHV